MKRLSEVLFKGAGFSLVMVALGGVARAGIDFPEIDPGSMASAMALLSGGVLLITSRRRAE